MQCIYCDSHSLIPVQFTGGGSLEMLGLSSPPHLQLGHSASLKCMYDLHNNSLYSLKWYKDGEEFFRFMPSISPNLEVFAVPGITIDVSQSNFKDSTNLIYLTASS